MFKLFKIHRIRQANGGAIVEKLEILNHNDSLIVILNKASEYGISVDRLKIGFPDGTYRTLSEMR